MLLNVIPCALPDIWAQITLEKLPLAAVPFLVPNKRMTGITSSEDQVTALGAGDYTVPALIERQARSISINAVPQINDREVWNSRVVWHAFNSNLYTLDGNVFAASTPAANSICVQKYTVPDWTVPNQVAPGVLNAVTGWMPCITADGRNLLVGVTAANGADLMTRVMAKIQPTQLPTWIFSDKPVMPNVIVGSEAKTVLPFDLDDATDLNNSSVPSPTDGTVMSATQT